MTIKHSIKRLCHKDCCFCLRSSKETCLSLTGEASGTLEGVLTLRFDWNLWSLLLASKQDDGAKKKKTWQG